MSSVTGAVHSPSITHTVSSIAHIVNIFLWVLFGINLCAPENLVYFATLLLSLRKSTLGIQKSENEHLLQTAFNPVHPVLYVMDRTLLAKSVYALL